MRSHFRNVVVALAVLVVASSAAAQTFTGGLRGAVKDANGVIPGVTVQLLNEGTGAAREAVSNDEGLYNFAAVPPGVYTVRATLTGFKSYEQKAVRVAAQQFVTVDVTLEVGALEETITVTGEAPLIDTANATGGGVINTEQLNTLPSGGRSAFLFAVTLPTVVATGDPQFNRQQDQTNASLLSLGGGTRRGNNYLIDGVPVGDIRNRASANPSIEALDDVAVQVHQYDAETGRTGGGTFNVATKSGTNTYAASGFYQNRPRWGAANNFFADKAGIALPNTYFHLGGGGLGGPIVKNRTFFWGAVEGYGSMTTRNAQVRLPTAREKAGDFSQSFDSAGRRVVIFDPLTGDASGNNRQPFPGNIIPSNRINPVAARMLGFLPNPTNDRSNGLANFESQPIIEDRAMMYTGKVDHRINDKLSLNAFYLYNKTDEPCANAVVPQGEANAFIDSSDYVLRRRVQLLGLNNTWLPSSNTVVTLRGGLTQFRDDDTLSVGFDPASLGFAPAFGSAIRTQKFPRVGITDYYTMGAIDPSERNLYSYSANATVSKLLGRHTLKAGVDYRTVGIDTQSFSGGAGVFNFDRRYTSSNPNVNGTGGTTPSGNALASMLLGLPSGDPDNLSRINVSERANYFLNYYGGYLQDDFRINPKLTINGGVRFEYETGLREKNDRFTVGFDRTVNPGGRVGAIVNPLTGQPMRGGLMYAGVNGNATQQGNPPPIKISPRIGMVYSANPKTVVRGGYGLYWAPWPYQFVGAANYGQVGYSQDTFMEQGQFFPRASLTNPFPSGVVQPRGNALGYLEGVGRQIEFIDQDKRAPYVHQYSIDINRELPGNIAIGFEYSGSTIRNASLGGANDATLNINQLDPTFLSLGAALQQQVPNPFFGLPVGQGVSVGSPTITRAQLLRPFPQYLNILMRQNTGGRSQYHAAIVKFEKRMSNGWGGRINYTFSRLNDNFFAESNTYSAVNGNPQNSYNIDAEWSRSILDVPHKLVVSPIVQLPFGEGKRWASSGAGAAILGNITLASIIALESGFPIAVSNNSNNLNAGFFLMQRVNTTGADPNTDGSRDERLFYTGNPGLWLNSGAFSDPGLFTLGTGPRTLPDVRTPARNNWDFVATKDIRLAGRARAQIRYEVLNITNLAKTAGPVQALGSATFGRITTQRGFMRLTQLMFRLSF